MLKKKLESELANQFKKHLYTKYGRDSFAYKVYSSGYGEQGFPDWIVKLPHIPYPLFIEFKRSAQEELRATQVGMHAKIIQSSYFILVIDDVKTIVKDKESIYTYIDSTYLFSGFDSFLETYSWSEHQKFRHIAHT